MGRLPKFRNLIPLHFFRLNLLYFVLFVLLKFKICAACTNLSETKNSDSEIHLAKTPRAPSSDKIFS
jgi:hypothetical protein